MHVKEQEDDDTDELLKQAVPTTDSTQEEKDEERKQATTHMSVPPDVVHASKGKEREKWLEAGRKEIDNLTLPKAITTISPQEKSVLRDLARVNGENYVELPSKVVFTIKPEKYKIRIVACGNQTDDTFGKITTTDCKKPPRAVFQGPLGVRDASKGLKQQF